MKKFFAASALILLLSPAAHAGFTSIPCDFQDYKAIDDALEFGEIREGAVFKTELKRLMIQEMGPSCALIQYDEVMPGIPGDKVVEYQINSGPTFFTVLLTSSIESGGDFVTIKRMSAEF